MKLPKVRKVLKILLWISACILIIGAIGFAYINSRVNQALDQVGTVEIPKTDTELKITEEAASLDTEITNIALFGVDTKSLDKAGRSDSIIILSIDRQHKKLKLSSIMRDTYVNVDGYGMTKLNHAYAYGGETLAIKTINENFNLNVKDFVSVDFEGLKKIVDYLGGVQVEIKSYEIPSMKAVGINSAGTYNLTGKQALTYARIRHQGNGDYERTDRQRKVLSLIFDKIRSQGVLKFPEIASQLLPYTKTSLSKDNIIKIGTSIFTSNIKTVEQKRFPQDGYCKDKTIKGVYYLVTDLKATAEQIKKFIYE